MLDLIHTRLYEYACGKYNARQTKAYLRTLGYECDLRGDWYIIDVWPTAGGDVFGVEV